MDTGSREQRKGAPEDLSEEFFKIVARIVDFGDFAPNDPALRDLIVRMTALGQSVDAITLVHRSSGFGEKEAQHLIERIESAADRVFYATGLRPAVRPQSG